MNVWRGGLSSGVFIRDELRPPIGIEEAVFHELDGMARRFVADWIWFDQERREDIAVEAERYAQYGYAVAAANVRTSKLHRMRADAGEGRPLVHSTLGPEDLWAKDLVLATWAAED